MLRSRPKLFVVSQNCLHHAGIEIDLKQFQHLVAHPEFRSGTEQLGSDEGKNLQIFAWETCWWGFRGSPREVWAVGTTTRRTLVSTCRIQKDPRGTTPPDRVPVSTLGRRHFLDVSQENFQVAKVQDPPGGNRDQVSFRVLLVCCRLFGEVAKTSDPPTRQPMSGEIGLQRGPVTSQDAANQCGDQVTS